jgi:hypothetical protein
MAAQGLGTGTTGPLQKKQKRVMQLGHSHSWHFVQRSNLGIRAICLLHFPHASAIIPP